MAKKGKKVISVDFTGVEAGSAGKLLDEGQYKFEIDEIEEKEGDNSGKPYLAVTLKVADGEENEGTKAWDNFSLQPQALWKLRGFLDACGIETVDGEMDIDPDDLLGTVVIGDVVHEEYQGKNKHRIAGYTAVEDDEPAKPTAKPAGGAKKKVGSKAKEEEPESPWSEKQKVKFKDGKKWLTGKITSIDGDTITVDVAGEEYEMGPDDLEAA